MSSVASWPDLWAAAQEVDILSAAQGLGAKLKKQGREYVGSCLAGCAKRDGFVVDQAKGLFLCRPSGKGGNVIQMVEHIRGCSRTEAAEYLAGQERPSGREASDQERQEAARRRQKQTAENERRTAAQARLEAAKLVRDGEAVDSIIERAVPFIGSKAEDYIAARYATMPRALTRDLRFVEDVHYWGHANNETDEFTLVATLPAMVALIRSLAGDVVGVHLTYLDPRSPKKWIAPWESDLPKELRRNPAKKWRKAVERINGSMIRLGAIGETLVLGEGIETVGSYQRRGFAPEDASFGVAMSLGNLAGAAVATIDHPEDIDPRTGRPKAGLGRPPRPISNGIPDRDHLGNPGVQLPAQVKRVILLGDGDSDFHATRAALATAARRYIAEGREVMVHMAPQGHDFASMPHDLDASTA